ncbi:hypothetical protein, partial [Zhouia amylolytica]|uniref:hypothetical protein n=1 Tax=Zhouia amylolytica TaxID=376730 RepID=UPI0020CD3A05
MKKIAIFCNSSNIDFQNYFKALLKYNEDKTFVYLSNINVKRNLMEENKSIITSSYTSNSFVDKYSILDFLLSFPLIIYLKFKRVKIVHFISAHSSNIAQALFARVLGIKVAFTIHDLVPHPDKKSKIIEIYNEFIIKYLGSYIVVHTSNHK